MSRHDLTPLLVLATVDPLLRDAVAFGVVVDRPRTVVLRHDIVDGPDGGGIRRVVADASGVVEDVLVPLEHACLSCSVREDAVPTLERLARDPRWDAVLLALPVSAESLPVTRALGWAVRRGGGLRSLRLAGVVAALDLATLEHDLLGDDLLDESAGSRSPRTTGARSARRSRPRSGTPTSCWWRGTRRSTRSRPTCSTTCGRPTVAGSTGCTPRTSRRCSPGSTTCGPATGGSTRGSPRRCRVRRPRTGCGRSS
ncbi:CobW-like GTP-binding protein [Cellulomonas sp. Y8]|uniref:CobW-like GTP-binding protein n=1 Tax=Cellulomonas sp. Y8 TaxID=2591145 RepID=UPI001FEDC869|nr:CobW-like GTP-binding protein [Cellulomonas sp. Y8]